MSKLDGRVALVTGASRGIGAAIAIAFGREGAMVAVNYNRSEARAAEVVAVIEAAGGKARALHADVTDAAAVRALVEQTVTRALAREVGPRTAIFALRRFGLPDEVAPTAVFLASDDSSYYAGQTLCPNGGDIMV